MKVFWSNLGARVWHFSPACSKCSPAVVSCCNQGEERVKVGQEVELSGEVDLWAMKVMVNMKANSCYPAKLRTLLIKRKKKKKATRNELCGSCLDIWKATRRRLSLSTKCAASWCQAGRDTKQFFSITSKGTIQDSTRSIQMWADSGHYFTHTQPTSSGQCRSDVSSARVNGAVVLPKNKTTLSAFEQRWEG